jgi:peroxiredoxin
MLQKYRSAAAGILCALGAVACGPPSGSATSPGSSSGAKAGALAADFATRDVEGRTVKLSDHLGKEVILLDFWATYCEPCLAEMPHLRALYEKHKPKGFIVLAISMDGPETVADVPSFVKRNGMIFPVLFDEDSRIVSLYNPKKSAPLSILIDRSGKIVRVHEGYNPGDEEQIEAAVSIILDRPPAAQ